MAHLKNDTALLARVRRIAGQMSAVERSIEGEADCASVLQQVAAVRGAINGLMDEILEAHLHEHVAAPGLSDAERRQGAEDVMAAIRRYAK